MGNNDIATQAQQKHMQVDMIMVKVQEFLDGLLDPSQPGHMQVQDKLLEACFWAHQNVNMQAVELQSKEEKDNGDGSSTSELGEDSKADATSGSTGSGGGATAGSANPGNGSIEFPSCGTGEDHDSDDEGKVRIPEEGKEEGQVTNGS